MCNIVDKCRLFYIRYWISMLLCENENLLRNFVVVSVEYQLIVKKMIFVNIY